MFITHAVWKCDDSDVSFYFYFLTFVLTMYSLYHAAFFYTRHRMATAGCFGSSVYISDCMCTPCTVLPVIRHRVNIYTAILCTARQTALIKKSALRPNVDVDGAEPFA
ncbi:hypothetical protein PENSPDRAFT_248210 [Peniophora sp. CONT]|nr:hypothetical protein PENSPDRAFT_248210 [Peniophora sp. CONT]